MLQHPWRLKPEVVQACKLFIYGLFKNTLNLVPHDRRSVLEMKSLS